MSRLITRSDHEGRSEPLQLQQLLLGLVNGIDNEGGFPHIPVVEWKDGSRVEIGFVRISANAFLSM